MKLAIIEIFNIKGQLIDSATLTETTSEGSEYVCEGSKFGSGIFFYRLKTDSYSEVKKMIMLQ